MLQMNPDDLINLNTTFTNKSIEVGNLRTEVDNALEATVWESPAADQFREIWTGEFVPMLANLQQALTDAAAGVHNSLTKVVDANSSI